MKAAFFDVDGTLTQTRIWAGLLAYFKKNKIRRWTRLFFNIYHYPLMLLYYMKLIPVTRFRQLWASHLGWFFKGYSVEEAEEIWDWVVENYVSHHWREDVLELLAGHRQKGDIIVLVSGGPEGMVRRIGEAVGATYGLGTIHQKHDGRYTGRSSGPVCIDGNKALFTMELIAREGLDIDLESSFAYADSPADIPLLELVGHPVAVYPDDRLLVISRERGWGIFPKQNERRG